jgi:hypothetical protein
LKKLKHNALLNGPLNVPNRIHVVLDPNVDRVVPMVAHRAKAKAVAILRAILRAKDIVEAVKGKDSAQGNLRAKAVNQPTLQAPVQVVVVGDLEADRVAKAEDAGNSAVVLAVAVIATVAVTEPVSRLS